jgi:MFS family permease
MSTLEPSDNPALFSIMWSLSSPISNLLFGRLSDRLGRRWFVVGANMLGIVGGTYDFENQVKMLI